jgi:hypothetical protein
VAPHDDYLHEFPFLGVPNAEAASEGMAGDALLTPEHAT